MFTVEQIELAHVKVKSGVDFPKYIKEIKSMGVTAFETYVMDSHTNYFGNDGYPTKSEPKYKNLKIADFCEKDKFEKYLQIHQNGETDYFTFCKHCAETGIEKWIVNLDKMTCIYYDKAGNEIVTETVPTA